MSSVVSKSIHFKSEFHNIAFKLEESNHSIIGESHGKDDTCWSDSVIPIGKFLSDNIEERLRLVISKDGRRPAKKSIKLNQIKTNGRPDEMNKKMLSQSIGHSYTAEIDWSLLNDANEQTTNKPELKIDYNVLNSHDDIIARKLTCDNQARTVPKNQSSVSVITPSQLAITLPFDDWL
jgi:hypothetical protein